MNTYKEIIYMILDEVKAVSDDSYFEEEHIIFLMKTWRAALLGQRYGDVRRDVPIDNYQTVCLDLEQTKDTFSFQCENGYLKSTVRTPATLKIGSSRLHPEDMFAGDMSLVSFDRFKYVGHNKYLKNVLYGTIAPDNHVYIRSANPQFKHLEKVRLTAVFTDPEDAHALSCDSNDTDGSCDVTETLFPLEARLIPNLIQVVVRELLGASYRPQDNNNNAKDDMGDIANLLASITNRNFQRLTRGEDNEQDQS